MKAIILTIIASVALVTGTVPDTCTPDDCSNNCQTYDSQLASCGSNPSPSCYCNTQEDVLGTVTTLDLCVACDRSGLGASSLTSYQVAVVVCNYYLALGKSAAESMGSRPTSATLQTYSSTYKPLIEDSFCSSSLALASYALSSSTVSTTAALLASTTISTGAVSPALSTSTANVAVSTSAAAGTSLAITTSPTANTVAPASSSRAAGQRNWPASVAVVAMPVIGAML